VDEPSIVQRKEAFDHKGKHFSGLFKGKDFVRLLGLSIDNVTSITILTNQVLELLIFISLVKLHDIRRVHGLETFDLAFKVFKEV
jgi:hypothetical protein